MNSGQIDTKIKCSHCGELLNGFTGVAHEEKPSDDDFSICFYCGTLGKYANNVTKLVPVSKEELAKLKLDDPQTYKAVIATIIVIKRRRNEEV